MIAVASKVKEEKSFKGRLLLGQDKAVSNFITRTLPLLVLSLGLFFGGIVVLFLRIPGWSIILGLPSVQIGIIFLIFAFDEVAKNRLGLGGDTSSTDPAVILPSITILENVVYVMAIAPLIPFMVMWLRRRRIIKHEV